MENLICESGVIIKLENTSPTTHYRTLGNSGINGNHIQPISNFEDFKTHPSPPHPISRYSPYSLHSRTDSRRSSVALDYSDSSYSPRTTHSSTHSLALMDPFEDWNQQQSQGQYSQFAFGSEGLMQNDANAPYLSDQGVPLLTIYPPGSTQYASQGTISSTDQVVNTQSHHHHHHQHQQSLELLHHQQQAPWSATTTNSDNDTMNAAFELAYQQSYSQGPVLSPSARSVQSQWVNYRPIQMSTHSPHSLQYPSGYSHPSSSPNAYMQTHQRLGQPHGSSPSAGTTTFTIFPPTGAVPSSTARPPSASSNEGSEPEWGYDVHHTKSGSYGGTGSISGGSTGGSSGGVRPSGSSSGSSSVNPSFSSVAARRAHVEAWISKTTLTPTQVKIAHTILKSAWWENEEPEPEVRHDDELVKRGLLVGNRVGGSRFRAFLDEENGYKCTFDHDGVPCSHGKGRTERALGTIRGFFRYKPVVCNGGCGMPCNQRFVSVEQCQKHVQKKRSGRVACPDCGSAILPANMSRHRRACHSQGGDGSFL
ncbi:hypothetical protein FRC19_001167 [Serendipita sp. 401]|nr:hypothetical protein FRC19_001167 [Serendipita sp. 401]